MRSEEQLSRLAEAEVRKQLRWEAGAVHAREQLVALNDAREDDAEMEAMLEDGRLRAARAEARRKRLADAQKSFMSEQLTLSGDVHGYGLESKGVVPVRDGVKRIVNDMFAIRARKIQAMLHYRQVEVRHRVYRQQVDTLGNDLQQTQRALRALKQEEGQEHFGQTKGKRRREMRKLHHKEKEVFAELCDIQGFMKEAQEEMDSANALVQGVTVRQAKAEADAAAITSHLGELMTDRHHRIVTNRGEIAEYEGTKHEDMGLIKYDAQRVKRMRKELRRLKGYRKKWIDSDVWQPGVYQRINAAELRDHLEVEERAITKLRGGLKGSVRALNADIARLTLEVAEMAHDSGVVVELQERMERLKKKTTDRPLMDELEEKLAAEKSGRAAEAVKIHALQVHEAAGSAGWTTLSDEVRHKPHKERAWEEKKWVGLDVMVNAGKYLHVTELEAEDMKVLY